MKLLKAVFLLASISSVFLFSGCEETETQTAPPADQQVAELPEDLDSAAAEIIAMPGEDTAAKTIVLKEAYHIRNKQYDLLLRPRNANRADGAPIVLYPEQPWKCLSWRFDKQGDNSYQLVNFFTRKTIQPQDGQTESPIHVVQASVAQEATQLWKFIPLENGTCQILSVGAADMALTAIEDESLGDIRIVLMPYEGTEQQQWILQDLPERLTM